MNQEFNQLVDEILQFLWSDSPVFATFMGIHAYDGELDRMGPDHRTHSITRKKEYRHKLDDFQQQKSNALDSLEKMDLTILRNSLSVEIELQEKVKKVMRDASVYPEIALFGIYILVLRETLPLETRAHSVLGRLRQIPRLLEEGIENLRHGENIPKIWTDIAIETTQSGQSFFIQMIPAIADKVPDLTGDLLSANTTTLQALENYQNFLQQELLPKSTGSFALGRNLFQFLLNTEHQLPYSVDELLDLGNDMVAQTQEKIYRTARGINSMISWRSILEESKNEHPPARELIPYYNQAMEECRQFVVEKNLLSIPDNQTLQVIETPVFERGTTPYAAYIPPAPFEEKQQGYFWVTPVDSTKSKELQEEQLQGHSIYSIPITVAHEAYPGHHVQLCHTNRLSSKVRRQFGTNVFIEGWALYCEELMWENGFYTDPRTRLMQLKDILWRACRVVIDVKLHTGQMTFDEAVKMLVDTAALEQVNAVSEVKRYTQSPTQPMSYLAGKTALMDLRNAYKEKKGKQFNLKEFHDKLLSYGSLPIKLIKEDMLKNPPPTG